MTTLTLRSKKPASLGDRGKNIKENRKATYKKKMKANKRDLRDHLTLPFTIV